MTRWLGARLAALIPDWPRVRVAVALSGGVDSVALLHGLVQLRREAPQRGRLRLRAIHVDHHLQAASADMRRHCEQLARRWRVPLAVLDAKVRLGRGVSVEAAAREARYELLAASLQPGEYLLTAQHADDQLETVLLQLLRGAGAAGLAAMPLSAPLGGGTMLRPLLEMPRATLLAYARQHELQWQDDPSNADLRFDRNFLRARVLPALRERWPSAAKTVGRSARHLAELQQLVTELARQELRQVAEGNAIVLDRLMQLQAARRPAVLREWLQQQGCRLPDELHLARMLVELPAARRDANPMVRWPGGVVRRYRGRLIVAPPAPSVAAALDWDWHRDPVLPLGVGMGSLRLQQCVRTEAGWPRRLLPASLQVSFRSGGELLAVDGQHRTLKELLRSGAVLPWMRGSLPLVADAAGLLAVPGLWQRTVPGAGPRVTIEWCDAPVWRLA